MVEAVTSSIHSLVQSVEKDLPYGELTGMKAYLQWTIDYAQYEEDYKQYQADLTEKKEDLLRRGKSDFRSKNGRLVEDVVWGWCPLWRVCCENNDVLQRLPQLPWRHDGMRTYYGKIRLLNCVSMPIFSITLNFLYISMCLWLHSVGGEGSQGRSSINEA